MFDTATYLNRIGFETNVAPTLNNLNALQKAHLLHIPFENLDIHSNTEIVLDTERIYTKIVERKRGGFCYELNGLFYELLKAIGFDVSMISARVYDKKKQSYGQEYDHLALWVALEGQHYLVDVGFGEFVFQPLRFSLNEKQIDARGTFCIDQYDDEYYRVSKLEDTSLLPQYIFTTQKRDYAEFEAMSHYHQTSADSHFTHKKFVGIPIADGRITLVGNQFKIMKGSRVEQRPVSDEEFDDLLVEHFNF